MSTATAAAPPLPRGLFWGIILGIDLILLASLAHAPFVAAGLLALAVFLLLATHPLAALAVVAAGLPLLDPVAKWMQSEDPIFFFGLAAVLLPLGAIVWQRMWGSSQARGLSRLWDPILVWSALLALLLMLGRLWTPSPNYGLLKVHLYLAVNMVLMVAAAVFLRRGEPAAVSGSTISALDAEPGEEKAARFLQAVLWLQIAVALFGVWNWFSRFYPFQDRLLVLGLNTIWVSRHMAMGILCLLALHSLGRVRLGWVILGLALMGWVMLQSGSRGPFLALGAALGLWFLSKPGSRAKRAGVALVLLLLCAAAVVAVLSIKELRERFLTSAGRQVSNLSRLRLLEVVRGALGQVGLFGLGTGGFSRLVRMGDIRFYPHNLFFEILLENGLLGMFVLVGFLGAILARWRSWGRALGSSNGESAVVRRVVGALLLSCLLNAQFSGDIVSNEWIWLWSGVLMALAPRARG